jgi:GNAT superfamily N-acetyltransferase
MGMTVTIRQATMADASDIATLVAESARALGRPDYSDDVIEAALRSIWGVDTQLLADGTYFLAHVDGELAAGGGWSFRGTLFGSDSVSSRNNVRLCPGKDPARIRAFFVRPTFARRGVGSRLLAHCEQEARNAGFLALALGATEPGRRLYRAFGFVDGEPLNVDLGDGLAMRVIPMSKAIR